MAAQVAARAGTVVLLARRGDRLEQLRTELTARYPQLRVVVLPADLSDEADVERVLAEVREQVGQVDVLVNNAGVGDSTLFDQAQWDRTRQVLATNVRALTQLTAGLVPGMVARGRGGVLNIGSGAGLTVLPAAAAYTGSKHFVDGFTEALRADLAGSGVVVTQVCPGPVDSEFDSAAGADGGMTGGPPQFLRISAQQCAQEALAGFDRGAPLVFPGRAYRLLMHLLPLLPRGAQRRQAARAAAQLRAGKPAAAPSPSAHVPPARPQQRERFTVKASAMVLTGAAVGTIVGTGFTDLNHTHVFNPGWPPHARFHGVAGWGTVTGAQLLALWLVWRPAGQAGERDLAVKTAALLPPVAWTPFFLALATRGTAVEDEPGHLPRLAGVPLNLVPATLVPGISALGYLLHRRGL